MVAVLTKYKATCQPARLDLSDIAQAWLAGILTLGWVFAYELWQHWRHSNSAHGRARKAHANLREAWFQAISERPGSEILGVQTMRNSLMSATLMVALFVALACAAMAVRCFSHASFISAMPTGSTQQQQWLPIGIAHVRKAGELYSWSLRALLMTAPLVASIAHPWAGPVAALALTFALWRLDQVPALPQA